MGAKRTIEVRPRTYQPKRAEIDEEFTIDATPSQLAKAMLKDVEIREVAPSKTRARKVAR
jgi:hypothetical protein